MLVENPMRLEGVVRPRASWLFWSGVAILHGVATFALLVTPVRLGGVFVAGLTLIGGSAVLGFVQWRRSRALVFRLADDGSAYCVADAGGAEPAIEFARSTRDLGVILVLVWSEAGSHAVRRTIATRGALSGAEWRLLRAWLRWRMPSVDGSSVAGPPASADS